MWVAVADIDLDLGEMTVHVPGWDAEIERLHAEWVVEQRELAAIASVFDATPDLFAGASDQDDGGAPGRDLRAA